MINHRVAWSVIWLLTSLLAAGCGDSTGSATRTASQIQTVSGSDQTATVAAQLSQPIVARVADSKGKPVAGQAVTFVVVSGGGSLFVATAISDANGLVENRWTLGTTTADTQRVEARTTAAGATVAPAVFRAFARADAPQSLVALSAPMQAGAAGEALPAPLAVEARDRFGNVVAGAQVAWTVRHGGGTLTPATSTTDAQGRSTAQWTLGTVGADTVSAALPGQTGTTFTASAGIHATDVAVGAGHGCAVTVAGAIYCWGLNYGGQLGNGTNSPQTGARRVASTAHFTKVVAGSASTCALTDDGTAYCWGADASGSLGLGTAAPETCSFTSRDGDGEVPCSRVPRQVAGGLHFVELSARGSATCGVIADGTAYCWGYNGEGQVGDGTNVNRSSPTRVVDHVRLTAGGTSAVQDVRWSHIASGAGYTCATTTSGVPFCWGRNSSQELGNDSFNPSSIPVQVLSTPSFGALGLGVEHGCGLAGDGQAYCWGMGLLPPTRVSTPTTLVSVAGYGRSSCGLSAAGDLYCGDNVSWGLVDGGKGYSKIATADTYLCGIVRPGLAYCGGAVTLDTTPFATRLPGGSAAALRAQTR